MKTRFLFPYWCRYVGLACILFHVPILLFGKMFDFDFHNMAREPNLFSPDHLFFIATTLLMLIGLVLLVFAKEKIEDEQISQLRLDSLQWAVYLNYFVLIVTLVFANHQDFKDILRLNLWIPLVFFYIRFRWMIFRLNRSVKEDAKLS